MLLPENSMEVAPFTKIRDLPDHDSDKTRHNKRKGSA